jgi:hypothetical protein
MASRAPRIAVVGSNMVDLVTHVNRMPAKGETIEAPRFEMGHGARAPTRRSPPQSSAPRW